MSKFTSSNLFSNNNKQNVPSWMSDLVDNLEIKEREYVSFDVEKRGVFAENQQVYRPEITANPRSMTTRYSDARLIAESKISLAKFLSGKYYRVVEANPGVNYITLNVKLDSVAADFQFPFEVKNGKLCKCDTFYANGGEYPFSKAGLEECLADIKAGRTKESSVKAEAIGKAYLISREEIIRRFNGSLRQATDRINQLLEEGIIVGAGSNTYASFHDVDQLFPQMTKEAGEERLPEFHFAPNKEHVAPQEYKTANALSLEASKILSEYFDDFRIELCDRDNDELLVKATILGKNGIRESVDFSFAIENEKVVGIKIAEVNDKRMTVNQLMDYLEKIDNTMLNRYLSTNKQASKHIYSGIILTKQEIKSKLLKVVESSKIDNVIKNWIKVGLLVPVNSTTYATEHTFEELLAKTNEEVLTDEQIAEINAAQRHFGEGLEIETDVEKPQEQIRDIEDVGNEELRLINANSFINKYLKQYHIASYQRLNDDNYQFNINFVNNKTGTRHNIPFEISFEGSKVKECHAIIGGQKITLNKLAEHFAGNKILATYLQDKKANLVAGPIVMTLQNMKRKLASSVTASAIDRVIDKWLKDGSISKLSENTVASSKSFEELLLTVDSNYLISEEEKAFANYQKNHFGKQIKIKTDDRIEDTGVREAEEQDWTPEKKKVFASNEIGKMFKDFYVVENSEDEENYNVKADVRNPFSGSKISLTFKFAKEDGKIKQLVSVAHGQDEVPINEIANLLERHTTEAQKQFAAYNKVDDKGYSKNLISKTNLINKLKVVASIEKIDSIINNFINKGDLQPINSVTFASKYTVSELVALAEDQLDIDSGKEQIQLANRDEHKISLSNKYQMATDTRKLNPTVRELTPQMIEAKNKLENIIKQASQSKKITLNKANVLIEALNNSKTALDLENVAKELRRYLSE